MPKEKSYRNKTIDFSLDEGIEYFNKCLSINDLKQDNSLSSLINKTICGDTFEVMKLLPRGFINLLIVDPPYNLTKSFNNFKFKETDYNTYLEYTEKWIRLVLPLLADTASIYVCCDWKTSLVIGNVLPKYFEVKNRITWQREKGRGAKENWKNGMEDVWFATIGKKYTFNLDDVKIRRKVIAPYKSVGVPKDWSETQNGKFRDTCPSNFWDDCSVPYWSMPENTAHPTQKPEKLLAKMISASSNKGDIVFDPFLGSGSTSVTAKKLKRRYLGIEQDKTYCAWAEKRLEMADEDASIQGYTGGVFWERNTGEDQKRAESIKRNAKQDMLSNAA